MSGNVVRIGDAVSCGDHSATGSPDVFADGMPITHEGRKTTTGHGCYHPTIFIGPWTSTVFVNSNPVALKDVTKIKKHKCRRKKHGGTAITGAPTVFFEA